MKKKRIEKIANERGYYVTKIGKLVNPKGNIIGESISNIGYKISSIKVNKKVLHLITHRLQAYQKYGNDLFIQGMEVRHKNGNKLDNSYNNIIIGTHQDNMLDIPKNVRLKKAIYASSFQKKYNNDKIIAFYNQVKSYKKTMKKFNISSKGTLHYILNK